MGDSDKEQYVEDCGIGEETRERFDDRPSSDVVSETVRNVEDRGISVSVVETPEAALRELEDLVPSGVSVMAGHSTTLEEIGFSEYVSEGGHDWKDLKAEITSLDDPEERAAARREAQTADYFFGSVNAIAQSGELVAADASGSRVGAYPFAAENLVLVSGTNKIMPSLDAALDRLEKFAYPLEDARAEDAYGQGSVIGKELILHHEVFDQRTTLLLVEENLGY